MSFFKLAFLIVLFGLWRFGSLAPLSAPVSTGTVRLGLLALLCVDASLVALGGCSFGGYAGRLAYARLVGGRQRLCLARVFPVDGA